MNKCTQNLREFKRMAQTQNIWQQGFAAGFVEAMQYLQTGGRQSGGQSGGLNYAGSLPGMTTQTRRRGRPRKSTTGATTSATRSHKKRTTS
jgi:hypothetical protein